MEESRIKDILDKNTDENNETIDIESLTEFLKSTPVNTYEFVFHDEDKDQTNHVRVADADSLQTFMGEHMNANGTYLAILDKLDNCDVSKLKVKPIIIFTKSQQSVLSKSENKLPNEVDSEKDLLQSELNNVLEERNELKSSSIDVSAPVSDDTAPESILDEEEENQKEPVSFEEENKPEEPVTVSDSEPIVIEEENKPEEPVTVSDSEPIVIEEENKPEEPVTVPDSEPIVIEDEKKPEEPVVIEEENKSEEPIVEPDSKSVVIEDEKKPEEPIVESVTESDDSNAESVWNDVPDTGTSTVTNEEPPVKDIIPGPLPKPPRPDTPKPPIPPPRPVTPESTNLIEDNEMKFESDSNKVKLPDWMGGKKNKRKSKKQKTKKKNQKARKTKKNLSRQKKTKKPKKTKK